MILALQRAVLIDRAADDLVAGPAADGQRFAGDHRLINGGSAGENLGVGGDALAGPDQHAIAHGQLRHGNIVVCQVR